MQCYGKKSKGKTGYWSGKTHNEEYKKNMSMSLSGKNNPRYGVKLSDEFKDRIKKSVLAHYKKNGTENLKGVRPQTSKTLIGHSVSEQTRKKIGAKAKLRTGEKNANWTGGKPKCIDCGKEIFYTNNRCFNCYSKINSKRLIKRNKLVPKEKRIEVAIMGRKALGEMKGPTSIEKKVYDELKQRGILFETQKLINGKFLVDAYIPSLNLIIECDGEYWHSFEASKKKDKAENAYLKACGYQLVRWNGKDINKNVKGLVNSLRLN